MEPITDKVKEIFLCNKRNTNIMCVVDIILADPAEANIDENWRLIDNQ